MKILIIGYGNPGRGDDGLGPALIAELEKHDLPGVTLDSDYQLNIEYSVDLAKHDLVIFVDASLKGDDPFKFSELEPSHECGISTHSITAESLLGLTMDLMPTPPKAFLLAVCGYDFAFREGLTDKATQNLHKALDFLLEYIRKQN